MPFNTLLSFIGAPLCIGLSFAVLFRGRRSLVNFIFALGMLFLAVEAALTGLSFRAASPSEFVRWQHFKMVATSFLPGIWLIFALTFGRANYKEFVARWRWVILSVLVLPIIMVTNLADGFFLEGFSSIPFSLGLIKIGWSGYIFHLIFLMSGILILMNLERTLRNSSGRMRWQIKFMVLGIGGLFAVRIYTVSQTLLFRSLNLNLEIVNIGALIVANILILKALFRARLFNVDFYLSHSFLYNSFTVLFVGIYLFSVGVIAKVATYFKRDPNIPLEAFFVFLALVGLVIFLLSDRLRKRMKRFISRNFSRPLYDYQKEWEKFSRQTTSVTEIKDLCTAVTKMVCKTLEVLSVSIWLVDDPQDRVKLGGTTVFSEGEHEELSSMGKDVLELIRTMRRENLPLDFDYSSGNWVKEEKGSNGDFFSRTRVRHCIPLMASGRLLGVMTVGDRVGGESFSLEDFDLLKTIADQTAGSLLNLKLSEDLRQAKEMEAFQSMSAFFIHDLKNVASKLSLMTQNLPIHFDNAEFRHDTVRTISQSLEKINGMCSRLSSLSQKLKLQKAETDLMELVKNTISGLDGCLKSAPIIDLHAVPRLVVDPDQIQKVLTNLILNANEALKDSGEIKISSIQQDGYVVLSISDNGCGMSREFIEQSLFRPFKTTKKQGMGIGLYQSKIIIEAHNGRIEVESEENVGTTFRVLLPVEERL